MKGQGRGDEVFPPASFQLIIFSYVSYTYFHNTYDWLIFFIYFEGCFNCFVHIMKISEVQNNIGPMYEKKIKKTFAFSFLDEVTLVVLKDFYWLINIQKSRFRIHSGTLVLMTKRRFSSTSFPTGLIHLRPYLFVQGPCQRLHILLVKSNSV